MWLFDFRIFYFAGQAVLKGESPYLIEGFISPYPLAMLFALFAWIPEIIAYVLYLCLNIFLLWKILGKGMIWPLLSFPVAFNLFVGQVDLTLALLVTLVGVPTLPLLWVKPQIAFVLAPFYLRSINKKQWGSLILISGMILVFSFILRPIWLEEWISAAPTITSYASRDSNLRWLIPLDLKNHFLIIALFLLPIITLWVRQRKPSWIILQSIMPTSNIYSASVLAEWIGPIEAVLSWIVVVLSGGQIHQGMPLFVIGISILIRLKLSKRKTIQE